MAALQQISRPWRQVTCCLCTQLTCVIPQRQNSNRCTVTKINRHHYVRTYPTMLVQPDGSTIIIRYEKPRKILELPLDLSKLTEQEKIARIKRLAPVKKVEVKEEIEDDFDVNEYSNMWKK